MLDPLNRLDLITRPGDLHWTPGLLGEMRTRRGPKHECTSVPPLKSRVYGLCQYGFDVAPGPHT
jgi:hypothetical protein